MKKERKKAAQLIKGHREDGLEWGKLDGEPHMANVQF